MTLNLGPVLYQYGLNPSGMETIGKVKKIYSNNGVYALKELEMSAEERKGFVHVLERMEQLGFDRYVRPFATRRGDPFVVFGERTYYLLPWLEEEEPDILTREEQLIETGAILHELTVKEQDYSEDIIEASYRQLDERWEAHAKELEKYAFQVEEHIYYSPFELAYLSHFGAAMRATEAARYRLKSWFERSKDEKRFRVVLCHGKFTVNHLIRGELLGMEHAVLDAPVRDLAMMFRSALNQHKADQEEAMDWLRTYEEKFPLRKEEKMLLAAYLSFPETICRSVREYESRETDGELVQVEKLEHRMRVLFHCQKMADQIVADAW